MFGYEPFFIIYYETCLTAVLALEAEFNNNFHNEKWKVNCSKKGKRKN